MLRRVDAWELRERLRGHPAMPARSARHCGHTRYMREVELRTSGDGAWWHGVVQCRARVCPPCFMARRFRAAHEIEHVATEREAETRCQSWLATFTVRHSAADPVSITRDVRKVWRKLLQSRAWQELRKRYGVEWIAAEEVTRGENGWHPHMHALVMPRVQLGNANPFILEQMLDASGNLDWSKPVMTTPEACALEGFEEIWERLVERHLGKDHVPSREHGADFRPCDSAAYLSKLGMELSDPAIVKGRSPLAMLDAGDVDRYVELMLTRSRARDITFSRGLTLIRDTLPIPDEPAELLKLAGTEWTSLLARGPLVPLEVADTCDTPETARARVDELLRGKTRVKPEPSEQ